MKERRRESGRARREEGSETGRESAAWQVGHDTGGMKRWDAGEPARSGKERRGRERLGCSGRAPGAQEKLRGARKSAMGAEKSAGGAGKSSVSAGKSAGGAGKAWRYLKPS
eukprot:scaffold81886_cov26-Tisochrysis_lutea.AAC.1